MPNVFHLAGALATGAILSACGGGATSGGGQLGVNTNPIAGVVALTDGAPNSAALLQVSGIQANEGELSIDFDGYNFETRNGFVNGVAEENRNSIGILLESPIAHTTGFRIFKGLYDPGTGATSVYYGLLTPAGPATLPLSGTVTFTGTGFANRVTSSGTEDLGEGQASVSVELASGGAVTATIQGLSGSIDRIELGAATQGAAGFSGSTVTPSFGGTVVSLGTNTTSSVIGVFSGGTATGSPDETGGLFLSKCASETLIGGFVAE